MVRGAVFASPGGSLRGGDDRSGAVAPSRGQQGEVSRKVPSPFLLPCLKLAWYSLIELVPSYNTGSQAI